MTLNNIYWAFTNTTYTNSEDFNKEVIRILKYNYCDKFWMPNEIIPNSPEIQIIYRAWIKEASDLLENETVIGKIDKSTGNSSQPTEVMAKLTADNFKNFTALEFLLKTHNTLAKKDITELNLCESFVEPEIINEILTFTIYTVN